MQPAVIVCFIPYTFLSYDYFSSFLLPTLALKSSCTIITSWLKMFSISTCNLSLCTWVLLLGVNMAYLVFVLSPSVWQWSWNKSIIYSCLYNPYSGVFTLQNWWNWEYLFFIRCLILLKKKIWCSVWICLRIFISLLSNYLPLNVPTMSNVCRWHSACSLQTGSFASLI